MNNVSFCVKRVLSSHVVSIYKKNITSECFVLGPSETPAKIRPVPILGNSPPSPTPAPSATPVDPIAKEKTAPSASPVAPIAKEKTPQVEKAEANKAAKAIKKAKAKAEPKAKAKGRPKGPRTPKVTVPTSKIAVLKKPAHIVTVTKGRRLVSPTKTPIGPGRRLEHRINKAYQMAFGIRLENMERKIDEIFYLVHPDCPNRLKPKWPMPNPPKPSDQPSSIPAATATEPTPATAEHQPSRNESAAKQLDYVDFEVIIIQHLLVHLIDR